MKPRRILSATRLSFALATALVGLFSASSASAQNHYWDSNASTTGFGTTTGTWGTDAFWTTVVAGGATHSAITNLTTAHTANFGTATVNYGNATIGVAAGGVTATSMVFGAGQTTALTLGTAGGGAITLGGSTRTVVMNTVNTNTAAHTINAPIILTGASVFQITDPGADGGTRNLNLGGVISSSATSNVTFRQGGSGSNATSLFILNGANTYTGTTLIESTVTNSNAEVRLGVNDALPTTTVLTIGGVAGTGSGRRTSLNLNGRNQTLAGLATSGGGSLRTQNVFSTAAAILTVNDASARTFAGLIGSSGTNISIVKGGAGTWTLTGANTYIGSTTLNQGAITVGSGGTLGGNAGALIVNNNSTGAGTNVVLNLPTAADTTKGSLSGTIATPSSGTNTATINTQTGRTLTINQTVAGTYPGVIAGAGNFTLGSSSTNALTLSGLNSLTGNVTVLAGTLVANNTETSSNGPLGAANNTRTITVASGATLQLAQAKALKALFSSSNVPSLIISGTVNDTNLSNPGNNPLGNISLNGGTLTASVGNASGYGSYNLNGTVTSTGTSLISSTASVPITLSAAAGETTSFEVTSGTLTVSAALGQITAAGDEKTSNLTKAGAGTLVLSGTNVYTGATTLSEGTLVVNGSIASSTTALTAGTLTGSGTLGAVNVANSVGAILSNNNGTPGASLTIGALTFNGAATVNTFSSSTTAPIVTTSLASNAAGTVTINPSAASWPAGVYDLISYGGGSISGAGTSQFVLGTVAGASPRQSKTFGDSGTALTLTIGADDVPYWVGDGDGKWNLASTNNWKLLSDNSATVFLATDNVLFNDNATGAGPIAVDIDTANVAPTSTTFNSTKNFTLGSTGGFGISTGNLTKSGTGTLTVTNSNTYTGNTVINGGVLDLSADGAQIYSNANPVAAVVTVSNGGVLVVKNFGQASTVGAGSSSLGNHNNSSGTLVVDGGTIRFNNETAARGRVINVGANGATLDVINNSSYTWSLSPGSSVPFTGSGQTLTLTGDATSTGAINLVIGGTNVSLLKTGAATWTLGGTNTYTGNTTISAGTLRMTANRIGSSPTIFIGDAATWNCTAGLTLTPGQTITGTGTTGFVTTSNTGLLTTSGTTLSSSGTLTFSRLDIRGAGNVISGGNIQSGSLASLMRGLLVGNGSSSDLTISGGTLTTNGGATNYDTIANTAAAGAPVASLTLNGGNYVNTANNGRLMLGNGGTVAGTATLTLTTGSATINNLEYNLGSFAGNTGTVNLDGGTLTLNQITSTAGTNRIFNFNGGQFVAAANFPAFSGVTFNVKDGGASINTNGFSLALGGPLLNNGSGGLTKTGLGTLTVSGANTYAGATAVNGGSLRFSTAGTSTTDITVAGGAEAGALVTANDTQWVNTGNLALQNNGAVLVDYGTATPSTTVAPISVTNFTNGTTPGVRLAGPSAALLAVSQAYPVATWTGSGPADGSAFDLRTHRLAGTFSVSSNTLFLTVTNNAIAPISWNSGDGNWDTSTANWVDSNLVATTYFDTLDSVVFGDAAGASGNPTVTLATAISPLGMTMNTTGRNYTVSGAGSIGGSGALTLAPTNVGTFTLATANNSFTGGTSISGGTLVLGDATNTLPDTGAVTVDGASAILSLGSNSDTVGAVSLKNGASITGSGGTLTGSSYAFESGSVSANLAGAIALNKSTTGTLTLSGANTFTGATNLNAGTLVLANTAAVQSSASVALANGTTLQISTDTAFTTLPAIGASSGALATTFISDRATPGAGLNHVLGIPNLGAATYNFVSGSNVTSGTAGISFDGVNMTSGGGGTTILNSTTATLTVLGGITNAGTIARTLQLDGTGTGHSIGGVLGQGGTGVLTLSKTNTSTWTLSGLSSTAASNYSGNTIIDQGNLALTTTSPALSGGLVFGAAAGSTNVSTLDLTGIDSTATFGNLTVQTDSTSSNTITLGSGKTLTFTGATVNVGTNAVVGLESDLVIAGSSPGVGSLVVNNAAAVVNVGVGPAADSAAAASTLDLKSLGSVSLGTIAAPITTLKIGARTTSGTLLLSDTANVITVTNLDLGHSNGGNQGGTNLLTLGTGTNVLNADTINIGFSKATATLGFASQTAGSPGTVTIVNKAGANGLAALNIGSHNGTSTGTNLTGTLDLRGHLATVNVGVVNIGRTNQSSSGGANGILRFDEGTFDATSLNLGIKSSTGTGSNNSNSVNIGGGTFAISGAVAMSDHTGTGATGNVTSRLNITNGTVNLGSTVSVANKNSATSAGVAAGEINVSGGTLNLTGVVTLATQATAGSATGLLNITGGAVTSNSDIVDGGGTTTTTITLDGGTLDMTGKNIGGATPVDALNFRSGTLSNVAQINGGSTGFAKTTAGTLILAGTNTYTGAASANGGILSITGTLNPLSALGAGGGTLSFAGSAPQAVAGFTVNSGFSTVTNTNAGATNVLSLGPITRNAGGVVNFANATATNNVIQTTTTNTNGILGPWALVGSDWAMNDGSGNIVAYAAYTDVARLNPGTIADDATSNIRIVEGSGSPGNIALGATNTTVNTLLQSDSGGTSAATVDTISATLLANSILIQPLAGALTVGTAPNSGTLTTTTAGGDLILANNSIVNPLTINSTVADNTSASPLIKGGAGTVILNGTNTYTGSTTVSDGTLRLGGALASTSVVVTNGTLQTAGNLLPTATVALGATSTFDLFGADQTLTSLANVAGNTITNSAAGTGTHTLTLSNAGAVLPALITDGPTAKTAVRINNANSSVVQLTTNTANSFSGGLILANNATGTRLTIGTIVGTPFGSGPITLGEAATDKAGIFFNTANQTLANPIIVNTALGTDRAGIRLDAIGMVLSGQITANLAPLTFSTNGTGAATLTGKLTGAQGLILDSAASGTAITITLNNSSANSDYAGDTVIGQNATAARNRTLVLEAANQIPNGTGTGNVVINTNGTGVGTLNLAGFSETINGLSGNGTVDGTSGSATLTLGDNNATASFGGVIANTAGTLSLVKIGTGTQTLSGASTYAGGTTVTNGTLVLGNASALGTAPATVNGGALDLGTQVTTNTVAIAATGTLTGSGSTGAAALAGSLTPGGSGSGLIIMDSATVASTSSINLQLAAAGTRGSDYDAITISGPGALVLDGTITVSLNGLTPAGGQSFDLINATSIDATTNFTVATDLILPALGAGFAWDTSTFATDGVISIVTTDPYLPWAASKGLTGANNAKNLDPDGDGKNNLYEFAFDGNPLSGANDGKVVGKIATVGADQVLTLTLPVRTGAVFSAAVGDQLSALIDAITYRIEGDESLSPFADTITEVTGGDATAIQTGLPSLSTGWTYRTFRAPGTVPTVSKAFLRAKISE